MGASAAAAAVGLLALAHAAFGGGETLAPTDDFNFYDTAAQVQTLLSSYKAVCGTIERCSGDDLGEAREIIRAVRSKLNFLRKALKYVDGHEVGSEAYGFVCTAYAEVASATAALGDIKGALSASKRAVTLCPHVADNYYVRGKFLREAGLREEAAAALRTGVDLAPDAALMLYALAMVERPVSHDAPIIGLLRRALVDASGDADRGAYIGFALAKVMRDLGDTDAEWAELDAANRLMYGALEADAKRSDESMKTWAQVATFVLQPIVLEALRERLEALRSASDDKGHGHRRPLFIVGSPRSGSTLVETILSAHPNVSAGGEVPMSLGVSDRISKAALDLTTSLYEAIAAANDLSVPAVREAVAALPSSIFEPLLELATDYLHTVSKRASDAGRVVYTDKTLSYWQMVPVLHLMFPSAKFVYMLRDPRDVAVSMYSMRFNHGHPYAYNLTTLAAFLRDVHTLMGSWQEALPPDRLFEVRYERLVADQEGQTRALLKFAGLRWDEVCLRPEDAAVSVKVDTASVDQVRKPVYNESIGKWQRYEKHLATFVSLVGGLI